MHEASFLAPHICFGHGPATIRRPAGELAGVVSAETEPVRVGCEKPADWPAISALLIEIGLPPREK